MIIIAVGQVSLQPSRRLSCTPYLPQDKSVLLAVMALLSLKKIQLISFCYRNKKRFFMRSSAFN